MQEPGIYLVNSTGESTALATESGGGDRELLRDELDNHGVSLPEKDADEIREKLEDLDKWRGDPAARRRNAMAGDHGTITALCWTLGMTVEDWDDAA